MNSVNVNIPMVNLPQVSHQQSTMHHAPIAHQAQNAEMTRAAFDLQLSIAREAEAAEGKIIDPEDRKEDNRKQDKKRKDEGAQNREENDGGHGSITMSDSGCLIDVEA